MLALVLQTMISVTSAGITLQTWNSSAGPVSMRAPTTSAVRPTLNFSWPGAAPFSAEATATISLRAGNYSFSLDAAGQGVNAYVWIDGHLVARYAASGVFLMGHDQQSGKRQESFDDVLPIGPFPSGALSGGLNKTTGLYQKAVILRVFYNPLNDSSTGGIQCPTGMNRGCTGEKATADGSGDVRMALRWSHSATAAETRLAPQLPIPSSLLTPTLPEEHVARLALQKSFSGWGTWLHSNEFSLVEYESGAVVTTMLCQVSTNKCMVQNQIESRPDHDPFSMKTNIRIGAHAWDQSYAQRCLPICLPCCHAARLLAT